MNLESDIHDLAQKLCDVLLSRSGNGEVFDLTLAYGLFTTDVVQTYSFGQPSGLLEGNDFSKGYRGAVLAGIRSLPVM